MVNIHKKYTLGVCYLLIKSLFLKKTKQKLNVFKMNENTNLFALTLTQQWFYVNILEKYTFLLHKKWIAIIYYYNRILKELI